MKERCAAELWEGLPDATASSEQQAPFVGNHDLRMLTVRKMPLQLFGKVMHVDDRALDADVSEPIEYVINKRLAGNLDQRFRRRIGQGPHARAQPGSQNHGATRNDAGRGCAHGQTFTGGTLARYQAAREDSAGWDKERCR